MCRPPFETRTACAPQGEVCFGFGRKDSRPAPSSLGDQVAEEHPNESRRRGVPTELEKHQVHALFGILGQQATSAAAHVIQAADDAAGNGPPKSSLLAPRPN